MENTITTTQMVELVIKKLNAVTVPISMMESVGAPVAESVSMLKACVDAWAKAEKEAKEKKAAENPNSASDNEEDKIVSFGVGEPPADAEQIQIE